MSSSTQEETAAKLREEMDARGWLDNDRRAGLAAIVGGESNFIPKFETGYSHTSNDRIRMIFPSRVHNMSDAEIDDLKSTDEKWFNFTYGGVFGLKQLGNANPGDGYRYRGGGLNDLTGRANYTRYGPKVGVDLVGSPELINTPRVAAAVAVEYMKDRFKGGDFDAMKRAVGVSVGEPDAEKNRLYEQYVRTGEWNYKPGTVSISSDPLTSHVGIDPVVSRFLDSLHGLETFLKSRSLYSGSVDDDPGPGVRAGLAAYVKSIK